MCKSSSNASAVNCMSKSAMSVFTASKEVYDIGYESVSWRCFWLLVVISSVSFEVLNQAPHYNLHAFLYGYNFTIVDFNGFANWTEETESIPMDCGDFHSLSGQVVFQVNPQEGDLLVALPNRNRITITSPQKFKAMSRCTMLFRNCLHVVI